MVFYARKLRRSESLDFFLGEVYPKKFFTKKE
jgi:hypothetical protein